MTINLTDLNYALMITFLIINVIVFVHNFRFSMHKHILLDNIPAFYAETELMHWSLYGSMVLPIFQQVSAKNNYVGYFVFAGILVVMMILAIIIATHRNGFNHLLDKAFSSDIKQSYKNAEKGSKK